MLIIEIWLSVTVLFCYRLTVETIVFQMIRLKACKDIDTNIDNDWRTEKLDLKNLIKVRKPKLMQIIQKAISQTKAILL